jgi:hypothetical protein
VFLWYAAGHRQKCGGAASSMKHTAFTLSFYLDALHIRKRTNDLLFTIHFH